MIKSNNTNLAWDCEYSEYFGDEWGEDGNHLADWHLRCNHPKAKEELEYDCKALWLAKGGCVADLKPGEEREYICPYVTIL